MTYYCDDASPCRNNDRIVKLEAEIDALRLLLSNEHKYTTELRNQLDEFTAAIMRRIDEAPLPDTPSTIERKARTARAAVKRAIEILGLGDRP